MNLTDAATLARTAMNANGLGSWRFEWDRALRRHGATHYFERKITLSRPLTEHATRDQVLNTIGHEIAHALVGPGYGHGPVWRSKMRSMGLSPDRCAVANESQNAAVAAQGYTKTCAVTGKVTGVQLRKRARKICKCHKVEVLWNGQPF